MKAPFLFLSLLTVPLYVHCSVQLVESGPRTVNPGGSLRLTCTVTGDSVKSNFWEWVRQAPGKGLEWMGQIDWDGSNWRLYYSPSFQSRITLTADASRNTYDLELRSVTAADMVIYYCARRRHSEKI
uniref:Ig-like domain-containing protein n=1 Tax=Podarcis muralis TaxID=64176 RepID=A0A670K821_PODMU